jgi:hypothetical protein
MATSHNGEWHLGVIGSAAAGREENADCAGKGEGAENAG